MKYCSNKLKLLELVINAYHVFCQMTQKKDQKWHCFLNQFIKSSDFIYNKIVECCK